MAVTVGSAGVIPPGATVTNQPPGLAMLGRARIGGRGLSADLIDVITSAETAESLEGASTLKITLADRDDRLLTSGAFDRKMDLKVDGQAYRLVGVSRGDGTLDIDFEDFEIAEMRGISKPLTVAKTMTRAQFARMIATENKRLGIRFVSPGVMSIPKGLSTLPKSTARRTAERAPGLSPSARITVQGKAADAEQRRNIERVLDVAVSVTKSERLLLATITCIIVENWCYNRIVRGQTDLDSVGLFQQRPSQGWKGLYNIEKATKEFLGHAVKLDSPARTPGQIAQAVQRSAHPERYDKWIGEAKTILAAYNGDAGATLTDGSASTDTQQRDSWTRGGNGQPEDSWACLGRLAEEVRWRRFMVQRTLYFVPDIYLLRAKPVASIAEGMVGIGRIQFRIDVGKPVDRLDVTMTYDNWRPQIGTVIDVRNQGPASGRWLVGEVTRDLFAPGCQVVLVRPMAALPEPKDTSSGSDFAPSTGVGGGANFGAETGIRDRIVQTAKAWIAKASQYTYLQARPYPDSLWSRSAKGRLDCSSSTILIYKEAGAPDPSGNKYNGQGETGAMYRAGRKVGTAKPGDLIFYGWESGLQRPGHVVVYVGDGKVVSHGGSGDGHPKLINMNYRPITGIRSYVD